VRGPRGEPRLSAQPAAAVARAVVRTAAAGQ
jgi:hypothetical protein